MGESEKANRKIQEVYASLGQTPEILYYMGMQASSAGNIEKAKKWYR